MEYSPKPSALNPTPQPKKDADTQWLTDEPDIRSLSLYLEGQGPSVSRLGIGITRVTIWVTGVTCLLTKSP